MSSVAAPPKCPECGFRVGEHLWALTVSDLFFVSDHRFPGRCVVTLREHQTELFGLTPQTRHKFIDDVSVAAQAVAVAVNASKMNYEFLGNTDPHLHCHLIPRRRDEPRFGGPAWLHPEHQQELPEDSAKTLGQRIVALLELRADESRADVAHGASLGGG